MLSKAVLALLAGPGLGLGVGEVLSLPSNYASADDKQARCNNLWESAPKNLADLTVNLAEYVPAGSTVNETAAGSYIQVAVDVGPFCRFSANITTSSQSSVRFEVWLPDDSAWNGHHMVIGNGGNAGSVYYAQMQVPVAKYGFAVASTNAGHDGSNADGTFALNNPESQIDFGYRAVHLSTVYSKEIVKQYYGKKAELSYWNGCSNGGKQGLKEIQMYPEDFDAALIGAPAWDSANLGGWIYYVNALVNTPGSAGFIEPTTYPSLHLEVLAQCDGKDGVFDGTITRPGQCELDYGRFGCGGGSEVLNSTTCLSNAQVQTFQKLYQNWIDPATREKIFPAYNIGSEYAFQGTVTGLPYGPSPSFFLYQVLNVTEAVLPIASPPLTIDGSPVTEEQLIDLIKVGRATNPGGIIADDPDLSPFFKRGGKVIHYVGGADALIPANTSHVYYERVKAKLGDISDSYKFFEIPGLGHCVGGSGAVNFGGAGQAVEAVGGARQSYKFDEKHDIMLALRAWREKGRAPEELIGAKFTDDDIRKDVQYTRPICQYPKVPVYQGGDDTKASSFKCSL